MFKNTSTLLILLGLFSAVVVDAAPTGVKAPAKAASPAKAATPAAGKGTTPKDAQSECPKQAGKKRALIPRAPNGHPDPTKSITLYHGTAPANAERLSGGVVLPKTMGDLSHSGGFYLTDRLRTAGQFACNQPKSGLLVTIFEYVWDGTKLPANAIHQFNAGPEYTEFSTKYNYKQTMTDPALKTKFDGIHAAATMVSAPMALPGSDQFLSPDFWQYAIVKDGGLKNLRQVAVHNLKCKRFPRGQLDLTDTQGPSASFTPAVRQELRLDPPNDRCIIARDIEEEE